MSPSAPGPLLLPVRRRDDFDWSELERADLREGTGLVARLLAELAGEDGREEVWLWALVRAKRVLGAVGVRREPCPDLSLFPAARIVGIYVHPELRGQGYGHRLLGRVLRHARGRFRRLTARAENEAAAGFLEHHGFVPLDHPCISHFRLVGWR